ncbi:MAG: hypothetical protein PHV05_03735 [Candidatus Riflebacteria bacterium]|nr:hypothetical protein [Candidatus Riflebacteria bacterium]
MNKPSQKDTLAVFGASLVNLCEEVRAQGIALQKAYAEIELLKSRMAEIGTGSKKSATKRQKKVVS